MQADERVLPWNPIPYESNRYLEVGVCRFEEFSDSEGTPVAVTLIAPRRDAMDGAWRLLFQRVRAYRRLPCEAHTCARLVALRETYAKRSLPTPATFEIVHSHWLQEAIGPNDAHPHAVHHFVIAASYLAYDIAAEWCDVQELGDAEHACADVHVRQGM